MNFGDNNFFMFGLNNHLKEENGNSNNNTLLWFSSWDSTTPPTSNSSLINTFHTTPAAEISAATGRHLHHHQLPVFGGDGSHVRQDPHLTCLHLGKRRCFEDTTRNNVANVTTPNERHVCADGGGPVFALEGSNKRGKAAGGDKTAPFPMVPRCQVEGCHVALCNAKDYHRRHRVCDMHSKAPKVVVLGLEQRFCQQCSRFHVMSAFDDSKRSCRRRLAGHNERRRKSTHSVTRNSTQGCALSLLSCGSDSWASHSDLSIRCNKALCELIEENRAAQMSRQVVYDREWHLPHRSMEDFKEIQPHSNYFPQQQMFPQTQ